MSLIKAGALSVLSAAMFLSCTKKSDDSVARTVTCKNGELVEGIIGGKVLSDADMLAKNVVVVLVRVLDEEGKKSTSMCTGTLIDNNVVLTAAHCYNNEDGRSLIAFSADAVCKVYDKKEEMVREVEKVIVHADYSSSTKVDDLAMLRFEGTAPAGFQRVPLSFDELKLENTPSLIVSGYGNENDYNTKTTPARLKMARVKPYEKQLNESGREVESSVINSTSRILLSQKNGQGVCNGDSGGPLFLETESGHTLVGVTSYAYQLGVGKFYEQEDVTCKSGAVFVSVRFYKDWILKSYDRLKNYDSSGALLY